MSQEPDCYIARKACGCIVAAVVDSPEHRNDTAKTVASYVRDGLAVERVTCQYVRDNMRKCHCEDRAKRHTVPGDPPRTEPAEHDDSTG